MTANEVIKSVNELARPALSPWTAMHFSKMLESLQALRDPAQLCLKTVHRYPLNAWKPGARWASAVWTTLSNFSALKVV